MLQTEFPQRHPHYLFVEVYLTLPPESERAFPKCPTRLVLLVDGPDTTERLRMGAFALQLFLQVLDSGVRSAPAVGTSADSLFAYDRVGGPTTITAIHHAWVTQCGRLDEFEARFRPLCRPVAGESATGPQDASAVVLYLLEE